MFKTLRDFWDRVSTRRKLQRKGLVVSRRRFDSEKLLGALEGSPAPGIFMLVMIWTVSAVVLTMMEPVRYLQKYTTNQPEMVV